MVSKAGGTPELASLLMVTEQLPKLVEEQVKAISNLKIDQITVWDSAGGSKSGRGNSTADFLSGLAGSLPPIHKLTENVGIKLPAFLGSIGESAEDSENSNEFLDSVNQIAKRLGEIESELTNVTEQDTSDETH
jgi:flotillin